MDVTLLCDVVDNYGDIGVVYRLSRALSALSPELHLTLVVSNLASFAQMAPGIDRNQALQKYNGWTVLDWNNAETCTEFFCKNHPRIILQCFQCIRPEWLENILFSPERNVTKEIIHIVNVEYLTAEEWADGFHLLKSATRSTYVKKRNFMPGFTSKTGGLILDPPFMQSLKSRDWALQNVKPFLSQQAFSQLSSKDTLCTVLFTYKQDFTPIIKSLSKAKDLCHKDICVLAAPGLSLTPFMTAIKEAGCPIHAVALQYMPQTAWDSLICCADFAIIRGEDSFARACLCGIPFLWHAYEQDESFQLVKADALLKRLKPFFSQEDFNIIQKCMIGFNIRPDAAVGKEAQDVLDSMEDISLPEGIPYTQYFCKMEILKKNFKEFSEMLLKNGNMAENLLDYIKRLQF
ncbi:MAG: elongation factor P maturation arginine rhamnosyltransferase EarP [Treponema sp.]|nr:elongation factor P maturation arginine rhamnosyltransferase EarP [Treponema sp.]